MTIRLENIFASALVDTGAELSVISNGLKQRLKNVELISSDAFPCLAADKSLITPLGRVSLNFQLGQLNGQHTFLVLTESSSEVILGWDFMRSFKVKPNPVLHRLSVFGKA